MDLPSYAEVMGDGEFCKALEPDGLPALYPGPATWALEDAAFERCLARLPMPAHVLRMTATVAISQRRNDAAYKYVLLLVRRHKGAAPRPPVEWCDLLLAPAGCSTDVAGAAPVDAAAFLKDVHRRLTYAEDAGANCPVEAGKCDTCKAVTSCQCACGESYCSKECQRLDWEVHAPMCYTVHDNGVIGYTILNKVEFGAQRGPLKPPPTNELVCAVCDVRGASKRCTKCKQATYCSRWCQKTDWKHRGHKERCGL